MPVLADQAYPTRDVDRHDRRAARMVDDLEFGHMAVGQPHRLYVDGDDSATEHGTNVFDTHAVSVAFCRPLCPPGASCQARSAKSDAPRSPAVHYIPRRCQPFPTSISSMGR